MYRRLVPVWVLMVVGLTCASAYSRTDAGSALVRLGALATLAAPGWLSTSGDLGLVLSAFLVNLVPVGVGTLLAWVSAFNPARRPRTWELPLRWLGAAAMSVYTLAWLSGRVHAAAAASVLLAGQVGKPPLLVLLAAHAPQGVVEALGAGLVFTAPLFWLIRTPQVRSFARASFEAWAEIRRLAAPALALLVLGAIIEVFLVPATTAMILQP